MTTAVLSFGEAFDRRHATVERLVALRFASRLQHADATLWGVEAQEEAAVRLGWVDIAERAREVAQQAERLRTALTARGITRVVLSGMGGSSLAPELICHAAGTPLTVLDSSHPDQVRRALDGNLAETVLVVSSKSGSTMETTSHLRVCEEAFRRHGLNPANHTVVVTDPESPLERLAAELGAPVFLADPNVGGRYSALTAFGIVPAVLSGADVSALIADAVAMREQVSADSPENPALQLAAALMSVYPQHFAMMLTPYPPESSSIGAWIEQLIAESTGKQGVGCLPVAVQGGSPETRGHLPERAVRVWAPAAPERPLTGFELAVTAPLGAQFMLWEVTTAALGALLGINPFDQPDVELSKVAAREILESPAPKNRPELPYGDLAATRIGSPFGDTNPAFARDLAQLIAQIPADGYLSVQAYVDREAPVATRFFELRDRLAAQLPVPVTLGFGPRFLHSTGQFHKGGPRTGVFLQFRDVCERDLPLPGSDDTFMSVLEAQANGDAAVLQQLGRPVLQVRLLDAERALRAILERVDQL